jgi:hypothetical protein
VSVSSDPQSWLRPFYLRLRQDPSFQLLSPSHQFEHLRRAVEPEQPGKAATMREWSPAAQKALLDHLASMVGQKASADPAELWRVRKRERELRCVAHYLPTGIDVRLVEADGSFRRTQLCRIAPEVEKLSAEWLKALLEVRWTRSQ